MTEYKTVLDKKTGQLKKIGLHEQLTEEISTSSFIPNMSDDDLRKLARERLSEALQSVSAISQPEMTRKLCAELLDRLDGKPGQRIVVEQNDLSVIERANWLIDNGYASEKLIQLMKSDVIEHDS